MLMRMLMRITMKMLMLMRMGFRDENQDKKSCNNQEGGKKA